MHTPHSMLLVPYIIPHRPIELICIPHTLCYLFHTHLLGLLSLSAYPTLYATCSVFHTYLISLLSFYAYNLIRRFIFWSLYAYLLLVLINQCYYNTYIINKTIKYYGNNTVFLIIYNFVKLLCISDRYWQIKNIIIHSC